MKGKIRVYARRRPMSKSEKEKNCSSVVLADDQTLAIEGLTAARRSSASTPHSKNVSNDRFENARALCKPASTATMFASLHTARPVGML